MKRCELCGLEDRDVRVMLGWYKGGGPAPVERCPDAVACRQRVEAAGETWPLWRPDGLRRVS